jgi:hypothetical protein
MIKFHSSYTKLRHSEDTTFQFAVQSNTNTERMRGRTFLQSIFPFDGCPQRRGGGRGGCAHRRLRERRCSPWTSQKSRQGMATMGQGPSPAAPAPRPLAPVSVWSAPLLLPLQQRRHGWRTSKRACVDLCVPSLLGVLLQLPCRPLFQARVCRHVRPMRRRRRGREKGGD